MAALHGAFLFFGARSRTEIFLAARLRLLVLAFFVATGTSGAGEGTVRMIRASGRQPPQRSNPEGSAGWEPRYIVHRGRSCGGGVG